MRNRAFLAIMAALALTAGLGAQDSYTIKIKRLPEVGKTVTVKDTDSKGITTRVTDGGGNVIDKGTKHTETRNEVYSEVVLEKGEKTARKYKRTYEKATRTLDGKSESLSYEGRTLVFQEKDGKFTVTPEGGKPIGKEDLAELTRKANEPDDADDVLLPRKPVKVGDTWKIEGKELVKAFGRDDGMDADRSSAEGKLVKVNKRDGTQFGTIEVTVKLGLKAPKDVKLEKPPMVEMKITLDTAIDGSSTAGTMTMTGTSANKGTVEQMGNKFTVENSVELSGKREQSAEK